MKLSIALSMLLATEMMTNIPLTMARLGRKTSDSKELERRKLAASRFLSAPAGIERVEGEYTLQFNEGVPHDEGMKLVNDWLTKDVDGAQVLFEFRSALNGATIAGIPSKNDVMDFLVDNLEAISMVEEDTVENTYAAPPSWGLDRIDQEDLPLDNNDYTTPNDSDGEGVDIYILDTGVDTTHSEFTGRIVDGEDFTGEGLPGTDPIGHGSHVAGTAAGTTYGVARGANIVPVRVFDSNGIGYKAWSIAAIDWVVEQHAGSGRRSVINMSYGGTISSLEETAIQNAFEYGIVVVAAAGNDDDDACNVGPANSDYVITVAASSDDDSRRTFSNWGSCVNIFAPGDSIVSVGGTQSGTSMAAPHVTGAVALLLQENPDADQADASAIQNMLFAHAAMDKISDVQGSPNLLLHLQSSYASMTKTTWSHYLNAWKGPFSARNGGDAICGFSSYHSRHSSTDNDRRFRFNYCEPKDSPLATVTEVLPYTSYGQHFSKECPNNSYISSIQSYYHGGPKDRKFSFTCSKFDGYDLTSCHTTSWANSYNGYFAYDADDGWVITGVTSQFDKIGRSRDRLFKFQVCHVIKAY